MPAWPMAPWGRRRSAPRVSNGPWKAEASTRAGIAPALAVATERLDPPTDALASSWYRREIAPVHLKRLLLNQAG